MHYEYSVWTIENEGEQKQLPSRTRFSRNQVFYFLRGGTLFTSPQLEPTHPKVFRFPSAGNTIAGVWSWERKRFIRHRLVADWSLRPCDLKSTSATARLLGLRFRILPVTQMSVACECRALSDRGHCCGPIPRKEESYQLCVYAIVCGQVQQ